MYKIGEFANKTKLSVRTLRYYDQMNVLKPGYVDYFSGYRYYTDENIEEAKIVELLKSLDFTLEEIALYKDNITSNVLDSKQEELKLKVKEINHKIDVIDLLKQELKNTNSKALKRVA